MKYALYLPNFTPFGKARIIAGLAKEAEDAGWDGLFIWDDIENQDAELVDPWVALSAAAMVTTRIRLGALITPLPRRRPWKFARETVTLDHLCEGRLIVGVGVGAGSETWNVYGIEGAAPHRGDQLDEALQVVTGLWSGEPFSFHGKHFHVKGTRFLPTPLQKPRIPIWVAGIWPNQRPLQRMAQWDGMFPLFFHATSAQEAFDQFRDSVQAVQSMRSPAEPFDVIAVGATTPQQPEEMARIVRAYQDAGATWWLEAIDPMRMSLTADKPWSFEQLRARVLAGPPTV